MRSFAPRYLFRSPRHHHFAPRMPALRTQIDHMIRCLNHIQVMFDQQHGMSRVRQTIQALQKPLHIRQMQTRSWLIQDINRMQFER